MIKYFRSILFLVILFTLFTGFISYHVKFSYADVVSTSVTVGNTAPTFDGNAAENPASDDTTPTNVGSDVTFIATANDSNLESYYLIICKTGAVTATNGGVPTCDVDTWCTSSSTASGAQSTCSYTVQATDTLESYDWYAFVCDANSTNALCSPANQGTGASASPFKVNHRPIFNAISNDTPKNPGQDITWSTDTSTLDNDVSGTADTVKLIICKTTGITGNDCDGGATDRWCASNFVASNPSCSYTIPIPTASGSYDAYTYLVDNHDFAATGANQGSNSSYTVNNITPVVTNVVINGGLDINLTEGTTTPISITADVTDNNGCGNGEISTVTTNLYRSGLGSAACDTNGEDDYDDCYAVVSCTENTCSGAGASYSCSVDVQYHADPTDLGTEFPTEKWYSTVIATDQYSSANSYENNTGVILNSLTALDVTSSINYGALSVGPNTGNLDQTTTTTTTGNVGIDQYLSGTDMDDGGINIIPVEQQKYDLASILYSLAAALTDSDTEVEINVPKTRSTGTVTTPETDDTYWGIEIPNGTVAGSYSGENSVTAIKGEVVGW
jgi:hypothetical protein